MEVDFKLIDSYKTKNRKVINFYVHIEKKIIYIIFNDFILTCKFQNFCYQKIEKWRYDEDKKIKAFKPTHSYIIISNWVGISTPHTFILTQQFYKKLMYG